MKSGRERITFLHVVIVGGGITGIFTAHYLLKGGNSVSIVEKNPKGSQTSIYNAGLLTPSLAPTPSMSIGKIISTYFGAEEPVRISLYEVLKNLSWFRIGLRKGLTGYEERIMNMGKESLKLFDDFFSEVNFRPDVIEGVAALYSREEDARKALKAYGVGEFIDHAASEKMGFSGINGGVMLKEELSVNPQKLYDLVRDVVSKNGAEWIFSQNVEIKPEESRKEILSVVCDGKKLKTDKIAITAGSWSNELCKKLGYNPHILPARGLVLLFKTGGEEIIGSPALLEDYGIGLAQHNPSTFRVTGFFEMVGFNAKFSEARRKWLTERVKKHLARFRKLELFEEGVGFRPCTPDQMPVIGRIPGHMNAFMASGNCRLGVTLGPATASALTRILTEREAGPEEEEKWYSPKRFN